MKLPCNKTPQNKNLNQNPINLKDQQEKKVMN